MPETAHTVIAVVGIDIGKNSLHIVGHDERGDAVLHQKWSRGQVEARLVNMSPCLAGMEACVGRIISVVGLKRDAVPHIRFRKSRLRG
jgi:transposase